MGNTRQCVSLYVGEVKIEVALMTAITDIFKAAFPDDMRFVNIVIMKHDDGEVSIVAIMHPSFKGGDLGSKYIRTWLPPT